MSKDVSVIDVDSFDGEVIFISPQKKKSVCKDRVTERIDEDLGITYSRAGINLPHAREHCTIHKFVAITNFSRSQLSGNNKPYCEKCYCFVCDDLASECKLWTTGDYPHCNAFAKNATWERLRASHKEANTFQTLLKKQPRLFPLCSPSADTLTTKTSEELKRCDKQIARIFANAPCVCKCYCHRHTGVFVPLRCLPCKTLHSEQIEQWTPHEERLNNEILSTIKTAINSIHDYLGPNQLESACVILEGLTRIFFSLQLPWQVESSEVVYNAITLSLKKAWIDVFIRPSLSKPLYQYLRDELQELLTQATKSQCFPLKNILCLRRKKDAINFLQGTKVRTLPDWQVPTKPLYDLPMYVLNAQNNDQRLVDIPIFRRRWIKMNANISMDNVIRVSVIPYGAFLQSPPSGVFSSTASCPVKDFTLDDIKEIMPNFKITLVYMPGDAQCWLFLMHALQVNGSLRAEENMEWILQTFCPRGYTSNWLTDSKVLDPMRTCAYRTLEELKIPEKVVHRDYLNKEALKYLQAVRVERFVLEVIIAFTCTYFNDNLNVLNKLIGVLEEKGALYTCESIFKSPKLADIMEWDNPIELFITKGGSLPGGSDCIPRRFFESWFTRIQPSPTSTLKAVNLLQMLINEKSSKETGPEFPISLVSLLLDRVEGTHGAVGTLETLIIKFIPLIKNPDVAQVLKQKIQRVYQNTTPPIQPEPGTKRKTKETGSKSRVTKDAKDELMDWECASVDDKVEIVINGDDIEDVVMDDAEAIIECSTNVDKNCEKSREGSAKKPKTDRGKRTRIGNEDKAMERAKQKSRDIDSRKKNDDGGNKQRHAKKDDKNVVDLEEEKQSTGDEWFSDLIRKGKFDQLEKQLDSSVFSDKYGKAFLSQITSNLPSLPSAMQRSLLRCCSDRLATILYNQVFDDWRHVKFSGALIKCMDTINKSHPAIFRLILFKTMNKAEEAMVNNRIGSDRRLQIIHWLVDIKKLCVRLGSTELWHKEFARLLSGSVSRKKQLFSALISCVQLARGNSVNVQAGQPTVISD